MPRGDSGRIVLEIDPDEKQALYEAVTKDGLTLKDWFLARAEEYLRDKDQLQLFSKVAENAPIYGKNFKVPKTAIHKKRRTI